MVLTDDEVKRIYTYRAGCRTGIELRNAAMLMLGLRLGFRASDVVNLKIEDIDWKQRRISIIQEKQSTRSSCHYPSMQEIPCIPI